MLLRTADRLALYSKLLTKPINFSLKVGMLVGRGFADVGYEEFLVVSDRELLSLNLGNAVQITDSWKEYFFPIFSVDDLSDRLYELGFDVETLIFVDQRQWQLSGLLNGNRKVAIAKEIEEVFLQMYLDCLESKTE